MLNALRALNDVGLMEIELGPRQDMANAKCTWTWRAYLSQAVAGLDPRDEHALEVIAAESERFSSNADR